MNPILVNVLACAIVLIVLIAILMLTGKVSVSNENLRRNGWKPKITFGDRKRDE